MFRVQKDPWGHRQLWFWYAFHPIVAKWARPKLKNTSIIWFFIAPWLSKYLQNYMFHRDRSPINMCRIKQGIPLQCSRMTVQTIIVHKLSENWVWDSLLLFFYQVLSSKAWLKKKIKGQFYIFLYFTTPQLLQKRPVAGPSTKRSSVCGLIYRKILCKGFLIKIL